MTHRERSPVSEKKRKHRYFLLFKKLAGLQNHLNPCRGRRCLTGLIEKGDNTMSTHTDERPNARASAQRMRFVSRPRFEDYREKYAAYFKLERQNGVIQAQMHTKG